MVSHLHPIVDRILVQLEAWKRRLLSLSGRLYLINSLITSKFVHTFTIYKWPASLLQSLTRAIRNILWSCCTLHRKVITIAWDQYCLLLAASSLGFKNLPLFNRSFPSSLVWKIWTDAFLVLVLIRSNFHGKGHYVASSLWLAVKEFKNSFYPQCGWVIMQNSQV